MSECNGNKNLEAFANICNDHDNRLPKGMSRCYNIGMWGGCGVSCTAFVDGECEEPQEIKKQDIIDEYGVDGASVICDKYDCFDQEVK